MIRTWKQRAYCTMPLYHPQQPGILIGMCGKAVGIRSDNQRLVCVVILPTIWPEKFDWVQLANQRLDTLLIEDCHCSQFSQCPHHQLLAQQWAALDLSRSAIVPEMVPEILQGIVTPRAKKAIILT
jgi:hypothetical protein